MNKVHFLCDEASLLGEMRPIDDAISIGRGYGIRLNLFYQSVGQLKKCFPEKGEQTLLSNTTQIFFAVNDNATADYVSARLGEETIVLESGGTSSGSSSQTSHGQHPSTSHSHSSNSNLNWQQQARKLLKPEEVMALPPRFAITFTPGVRPICTKLMRYYEEDPRQPKRPTFKERLAKFAAVVLSLIRCILFVSAAVAMSIAINRMLHVRL